MSARNYTRGLAARFAAGRSMRQGACRALAFAVVAAMSCAMPAARAAACAAGWNDAGGGICEKILDYNGTTGSPPTIGTVQHVTVPAGVLLMTMIVAGAQGQDSFEAPDGPPAAGGKGGRHTGSIPVVPGDVLNVFVGQWGSTVPLGGVVRGWQLPDPNNPGAFVIAGAFGGGGLSSSNYGGFGGGGSFVFDSQPIPNDPFGAIGNLLIAAGGGGGAGFDGNQVVSHGATGAQKSVGGSGAGATAADAGVAVGLLVGWGGSGYTPGAGDGGTLLQGGPGGTPAIPPSYVFGQQPGRGGTGPATFPDPLNAADTSLYLGAGGNSVKGTCCYYYGYAGAGGGGFFGGGAGGTIDAEEVGGGGGGGSGFIAPNAIDTLAETGVKTGDGRVILRYSTVPVALTVARNGSGSGSVTSSPAGIDCGATCVGNFGPGTSVTLTATPAAGSVFTGWLGHCTGLAGCTVDVSAATTVSATFAAGVAIPVPDADGGNGYDALTDGLLVSRYVSGLTGDALTMGALGAGATRSIPADVAQFLDDLKPLLDVDGNGQVDAATDGVLLVRYLLGFRGEALIAGAIGAAATRVLAADIETYLQAVLP